VNFTLKINTHDEYFNIFRSSVVARRPSCVKPLSQQSGVLTAFPQRLKKCRTPGCALCKRQQRCANAMETLCNRIERHAVVFVLSMLKTNTAAWRFHSVLDSTQWQRCGVFWSAVGALWARRVHAVKTPC